MSDVRPFAGLRYARDPQARIAPPYDVISDAERDRFASEPENVVNLTLPPGPSGDRDYAGAAATFLRWIGDGTLVRDPAPRIYVLEERTTDGRLRRGFLAAVRLADYAERVILPHERTMSGPKLDRLLLTREVEANLEPLFFLYDDRDGKLDASLDAARDAAAGRLAACDGPDGTALELYALEDGEACDAVRAFLADRPLIIADGHHRYETMLAYRDECRERGGSDADAAPELVMAYLVNAFDPGSRVQAIHRVLHGDVAPVAPALDALGFEHEPIDASDADLVLEALAREAESQCVFVLAAPGGAVLARRKRGGSLDVEVLHAELLPALGGELSFDARPDRLLATVAAGEAALGILLHPIAPDALFRVVEAGAVLPQKSTFFSPKIPTGLVIRDFS